MLNITLSITKLLFPNGNLSKISRLFIYITLDLIMDQVVLFNYSIL